MIKKFVTINLYRKNNKKLKASYTVEAALLMPFLIFIIFALCYLTFYLHDINILQIKAEEALQKQEACLLHPADYESGKPDYEHLNKIYFLRQMTEQNTNQKLFQDKLQSAVKKDFFIMDIKKAEVKITTLKRSVILQGKLRLSLAGAAVFFPKKLETFDLELSAWNRNSSEFARGFEILRKNIWE